MTRSLTVETVAATPTDEPSEDLTIDGVGSSASSPSVTVPSQGVVLGSAESRGWDTGATVICHGWVTKQQHHTRSGWWERYIVLTSEGLLGWYQQKPADCTSPGVPRCYVHIGRSAVTKQRHPPAALNPQPEYIVKVKEPGDDVPTIMFGSDAETVVDAWHQILLLVSHLRALPESRVPWMSRTCGKKSTIDACARRATSAGEQIACAGRSVGAIVESSCAVAGDRCGSGFARALRLPDESSAGRAGAMMLSLVGVASSFLVQVPGLMVSVAARYAGGARRPTFCPTCDNQLHEPLGVQGEPELLGQLHTCNGCGGAPVADRGCARCRLRLCKECFEAHVKPPEVHLIGDIPSLDLGGEAAAAVLDIVRRQRVDDTNAYCQRIRQARLDLANAIPARPVGVCALPEDWITKQVRPERGWAICPVREKSMLQGLQACLATNGEWLNCGRDVPVGHEPYTQLKLAAAWHIEHHLLWPKYCQAVREVAAQCVHRRMDLLHMRNEAASLASPLSDWSVALGLRLNDNVNEKLLAHGTKAQNVAAILTTGPNERFCEGIFGKGLYQAEDCGKCDQYVSLDTEFGASPELQVLHDMLYKECQVAHPKDVCYVFLCRAVLGTVARTKDGETELNSGANVFASADRRELASIPGTIPPLPYHSLLIETGCRVARYREVVVFHSDRIYPEYLVAYHRC
eukprot:gnl/TRDRNA2_/TRDRNA2_84765_c0_seq1.p1 gnl/TRDRNA2_/TRDRNA2_84765_c0~~gnl/TRDRNA2_/TRDRNA2_84765_c0_seq1.p1  ORF type:complete len:689 (-),score=74.55 gnl/TRDRNA2_/TRDRNA2_84765_c0_seq1:128-2194(-)